MINIAKLLKEAPKGIKLYSPLFGEVEFLYVNSSDNNILVATDRHTNYCFTANGIFHMYKCHPHAECLLFPNKECRTWEGWKLSVEPKFKVGDWITDGISKVKITNINNTCYWFSKNCILGEIESIDKKYHLWSIRDAKDGDVITNGKLIVIFNKLEEPTYKQHIIAYVGLDLCGRLQITEDTWQLGVDKAIPATKEQHDLLFAKMRESGYEWDAEKKELKKIIEPKFKVGDWVATDYGKVSQVVSVDKDGDGYTLDDGVYFSGSWCDMYHLWTIADAKDGDVLVCYSEVKGDPIEQAGIYKQYVGRYGGCSNTFLAHTGIDWDGDIIINGYMGSTNILPATKEQRELMFAKIKEAGYEWDADKKELRKIQAHYDIANFSAGMPVLVRDNKGEEWRHTTFSHVSSSFGDLKFAAGCTYWRQCIPFDGNEHLLGTTDMCDERFINW